MRRAESRCRSGVVGSGNLGTDCVSEQHRVSLCFARRLYEPAATTVERLTDDDVRTVAGDDAASGAAASSDGSLSGWAADRYGVEVLVRHVAAPPGDFVTSGAQLAGLEVGCEQRVVLHLGRHDGVRPQLHGTHAVEWDVQDVRIAGPAESDNE